MILCNNDNVICVSTTKVFNNCIKNTVNETHRLNTWLPNISMIDVRGNETVISLKDEKEEINLGFTGYEWIFDDYINSFYKEGDNNDELRN